MKKFTIGNGAATNSILLMMVHVITTVLGLIVTKLLSVHFSLAEYGTYSQALLIISTTTSLSILGLTNATNYYYNRTEDESKRKIYLATIFAIQYVAGTLSAVILIAVRGSIAQYFKNDALKMIIPIIAVTPMLTNLIAMYQTLFVSIGQAKKIAVRNCAVSAARLLSVIAACFLTRTIVTVLVVILLLDIAQVLYFAFMFRKDKYLIRVVDADYHCVKEILTFSVPMAIYVMTNSLSRDIDKYVISVFASTEALAIYSNAAKVLPFDMLTSSMITVLIPVITRFINQKKFDEARSVFKLYLRIGCILTCIFAGGAVAVSKHLMLFLYDEKYIAGLPVFIVYLFVDMIRFANVTTILSGAGKTKTLMIISIVTLALNGGFNVISYQFMGMIGPALTTIALTVLMTLALLHFGAREIHSTILNLFDLKEIALIAVEIFIFGVEARYLTQWLEGLGLPTFLVFGVSYACYLGMMLGLNAKRVVGCLKSLNAYR